MNRVARPAGAKVNRVRADEIRIRRDFREVVNALLNIAGMVKRHMRVFA